MTATGQSIFELAAGIPKLHIHKSKASVTPDRLPALFEALIAKYPEASAQTGDGLRLAWEDRWLLVRGSNTEPIVRLIAEADSETLAKEMCQSAAELL